MKTILWPRLNRYIPIWPTPKQAAFMAPLPQLEALYGGAAGGGKSVALLAAALMYADIAGYAALIRGRLHRGVQAVQRARRACAARAAQARGRGERAGRSELGVNLSCGASNMSFGMPDRQGIDAIFLSMAIVAGMNCAITNPLHRPVRKATLAADLLLGRDGFGAAWIADHRAEVAAAG